jgi:hypothetical protein
MKNNQKTIEDLVRKWSCYWILDENDTAITDDFRKDLKLLEPDVIKSVCKCKEGKQGRTVDENWEQICTRCGGC